MGKTRVSRVCFTDIRSAAMTFTTVLLSMGGAFCKLPHALPPPPFVPEYSVDQALEGFLKGPCGKALGDFTVLHAGLRGYQEPRGPCVILDLEIASPPSKLGVRYRTYATASLDPYSGEVLDPAKCAAELKQLCDHVLSLAEAAEKSPKVQRFIAEHQPAEGIYAQYEPILPKGRIDYWVPAKGEGNFLRWSGE